MTNPKPHPEIYLLAAQRLGIDPRTALVFEDSVNGAQSALAAGMTCYRVVTETTRHLDFPPVAGEVHSFSDLRVDALIQGASSDVSSSRTDETGGGVSS